MLKQLLISGVLLVSAVPPALAGPTGFWGTSQVPNVPCNIWGCPNAPLGAECTIRGCPPSPQVAAPIPQYPQYPQYPYPLFLSLPPTPTPILMDSRNNNNRNSLLILKSFKSALSS